MASDNKYTWADLEEAVTKKMVEDCKLDACLDLFLNDIIQLCHYKPLPDLETLFKEHETECDELKSRLGRLLPGYLKDKEFNMIFNTRLEWKLQSRWSYVMDRFSDNDQSDSFHETLWSTLMDQRYREQVLKDETDNLPPSNLARAEAFGELKSLIDTQKSSASFSCGGRIPVGNIGETSDPASYSWRFSEPVTIFWKVNDGPIPRHLILPINDSTSAHSKSTLQQLVDDCQPATFGRGQQDVFDPEYRKAGKMDPCKFLTSFDPTNFGIIESVEKTLLPSISTTTQNSLGFRKLRAKLYKLNVYSSPSGVFRKHVDTPRSESQIGSLVVCLPARFKGGALNVQHNGNNVEFDWGTAAIL